MRTPVLWVLVNAFVFSSRANVAVLEDTVNSDDNVCR